MGKFLAHRAAPVSLIRDVQTLTRVLPPDTAKHDIWYNSKREARPVGADDSSLALWDAQQLSYAEVRRRAAADAMVQRHFVVLSWPLSPLFVESAAKYGRGRDGWRALMAEQIEASLHGLREARMGQVNYLTARQTAAVIMHQQNPSIPIDLAREAHHAPVGGDRVARRVFGARRRRRV